MRLGIPRLQGMTARLIRTAAMLAALLLPAALAAPAGAEDAGAIRRALAAAGARDWAACLLYTSPSPRD